MRNKTNILKVLTFALALALPVACVQAATLAVDFEKTPLFSEANFLPGSEVSRTVSVTNTSGASQDVITEAINVTDGDGLGKQLLLTIKEGETTLYSDTLAKFLRNGTAPLSTLSNGAGTVYIYNVRFKSDADNDTMGKSLGFDLCVGFRGSAEGTTCGDTAIGGEGTTGGGTPNPDPHSNGGGTSNGSGSSGGGGGGLLQEYPHLKIVGESAVTIGGTSVQITWDTNFLSTSQVIYGPVSGGPYSINLTILPNFGYPLATVQDDAKVSHHVVNIDGLVLGETYVYRAVSTASPATVGFEYRFTVGASPIVLALQGENSGGRSSAVGVTGQTGGFSTTNTITTNDGTGSNGDGSFDTPASGGGVGAVDDTSAAVLDEKLDENVGNDAVVSDVANTTTQSAAVAFATVLGSRWLYGLLVLLFLLILWYGKKKNRRE